MNFIIKLSWARSAAIGFSVLLIGLWLLRLAGLEAFSPALDGGSFKYSVQHNKLTQSAVRYRSLASHLLCRETRYEWLT